LLEREFVSEIEPLEGVPGLKKKKEGGVYKILGLVSQHFTRSLYPCN